MIIRGDARSIPLVDGSVQCCVTSPPYWALRDYGYPGQLGQEDSPEAYVNNLVAVFREVWRVLRKDGTCWLNIADSYLGAARYRTVQNSTEKSTLQYRPTGQIDNLVQRAKRAPGIRDKSLALIPGRLMLALQADGWIIRSNIVWHKPNAMPSSVRDRPANAHEYIILMSKSPKYYYDNDAVKVPASTERRNKFTDNGRDKQRGYSRRHAGFNGRYAEKLSREGVPTTRNLRDVWTVATANFPEAHFATFPAELIRPCILAGCPEGGLVLDPFVGSGTTVKVAQDLGRRGVGLELNPAYIAMAKRRTAQMSLAL